MPAMSIGQFAAKAGVNASTLRYYESVGLLPPPERQSGQRRYDERLLDRIHFIQIAQQTGCTISEIATLLGGFETGEPLSDQWERLAARKREELAERKKRLDAMLNILDSGLSCKCLSWSDCMEKIKRDGAC